MTNKYEGKERRAQVKEPWHLDRRVPISLLFAIFVQTGGAFWFAGAMDERVSNLENVKVVNAMTREESNKSHELLQVQIKQNSETSKEIKDGLHNIDSKLDRLIERDK